MTERWWRIGLTLVFLLGLILCAVDLEGGETPRDTGYARPSETTEAQLVLNVIVRDARYFFQDAGSLYLKIVNGLGEKSPAVLGYLECIAAMLIPMGLWTLLNLAHILRSPRVRMSIE